MLYMYTFLRIIALRLCEVNTSNGGWGVEGAAAALLTGVRKFENFIAHAVADDMTTEAARRAR